MSVVRRVIALRYEIEVQLQPERDYFISVLTRQVLAFGVLYEM